MKSYHNEIQKVARTIEKERAKVYSKVSSERFHYSEIQEMYSKGAEYKILRARLQTRSKEKVLDDILDAYNYLALLYQDLTK